MSSFGSDHQGNAREWVGNPQGKKGGKESKWRKR